MSSSSSPSCGDGGPYTLCVIGASGFVGSHVTQQALEKGWKVRGVFRNADDAEKRAWLYKLKNSEENLSLFSGDLNTKGSFNDAIKGSQGVIVCALPESPSEPSLIDTVRGGVEDILESCSQNGVKSIVITSSGGSTNPRGKEPEVKNELEHWSDPDYQISEKKYSPAAKTLMEKSALKYASEHPELRVVIMNPNLIMGPVLSTDIPKKGSLPMLLSILTGKMIQKIPNGSMSIIDVRDLAAMELVALKKEDAEGRYFCVLKSFHWREIMQTLHEVYPDFKVPPCNYKGKHATPTQFDHTRKESLGVELRDLKTILGDAVNHLKERKAL